ncbi:MAG: EFR1 family ferrodoxin [Chloroflexi bacterium]|nr:EFR1 family ferrodoxin [Chloroflexota bacterium]MBU1752141.1 EFR1 family ferrodoxin [Chloroflexota bacterium]
MRLLVLYFSGTGNTAYVADYLARRLAPAPVQIEIRSTEQQSASDLGDFDVLATGFPVYGCDSPSYFQSYVTHLPPGEGRGAFAFGTKGAFAGGAIAQNLRRLAARGYVPLGGGSVMMPGTDGLAFVGKESWMARQALDKDYDHLADADRVAGQMAGVLSGLAAGEPAEAYRQPLPRSRVGNSLDRVWAFLYNLLAERYAVSRFWADERCNGCGLCVRLCPTGNVELRDGHPHFGDQCMPCMRCIHLCPRAAIQIGGFTVDKFRWHGPRGDFRPLRLRKAREVTS